jgi:hypothetical protein
MYREWTTVEVMSMFRAEDGDSMFFRNVGIFPAGPHGSTTQKTNIDISTDIQCVHKGPSGF